ncbi:hypothetical protein [Roseibium sediminis]|uniref:hypothetical protein n=1 Tax=Roseibium sediminis TaxID=1775174 RepID=UPI00123C9495|nr:hypothetical protein [Roseibium sediminis]
MSRGNDHEELAVALSQIKAAENSFNKQDGLESLRRIQGQEARERSAGAFFGICILVCGFGFFTGYATYAFGIMGFLAFACFAVSFWRYRIMQRKRAEDMRLMAERNTTDSETVG